MKRKNSFGVITILGMGICVALVGVGTAIGLATDELALGVGISVVIGVGIVVGIRSKYNKSKNSTFDKDGYLKDE